MVAIKLIIFIFILIAIAVLGKMFQDGRNEFHSDKKSLKELKNQFPNLKIGTDADGDLCYLSEDEDIYLGKCDEYE